MNVIGVRYIIFQWYILDHNSVCTYCDTHMAASMLAVCVQALLHIKMHWLGVQNYLAMQIPLVTISPCLTLEADSQDKREQTHSLET